MAVMSITASLSADLTTYESRWAGPCIRATSVQEGVFEKLVPIAELTHYPESKAVTIEYLVHYPWHAYDDFEPLRALPELEHLALFSLSVHDRKRTPTNEPELSQEQWEIVASLPIRTLTLGLSNLKEIDFSLLYNHPTLENLIIHFPSLLSHEQLMDINAAGPLLALKNDFFAIDCFNLCDQISELVISEAQLTSDCVEELQYVSLPDLRTLVFECPDGGGRGLRVDLLAPNLTYLDLTGMRITGSTVSQMPHLQHVFLGKTGITAGAIRNLCKISTLQTIDLHGTSIKGADFTFFEQLEKLEDLDLSGTNLTRGDLLSLYGLQQLKHLRLFGLTSTTVCSEDIQDLKRALPECHIET